MRDKGVFLFTKIILFFLLIGLAACEREDDIHTKDAKGLLKEIRIGNKIQRSFTYNQASLVEEKYFGFDCKGSPTDVFTYMYQNGKLSALYSTLRSLYSSSTSICDPALGEKYEEHFEYDTQGRLIKSIRNVSYTVYEYNSSGLIEKETLYLSDHSIKSITLFRYDTRGNLIEEQDSEGNLTQYQYDNHQNPFYLINQNRVG